MAYLILSFRLFLGGIFILSGFAKFTYPGSKALDPRMAETFNIFTFIPLEGIHAYVRLVPWIELFLAVGLIAGIFLRFFSGFSILIVCSFLLANVLFAYYGYSDHCSNCFGELLQLKIFHAMAIDLLMLALAVAIFLQKGIGLTFDHWRKNRRRLPA
jgi:uncharacterized membrane protein YphA (DoxX/SURF4 family)